MRQVRDFSGMLTRPGLKLVQDRLLRLARKWIHDAKHPRGVAT